MIKRHYSGKTHYRRYGQGFAVVCKCPFCGITHIVNMSSAPVVMPRVYCPDHEYIRRCEPGGYNYDEVDKARRRAAHR